MRETKKLRRIVNATILTNTRHADLGVQNAIFKVRFKLPRPDFRALFVPFDPFFPCRRNSERRLRKSNRFDRFRHLRISGSVDAHRIANRQTIRRNEKLFRNHCVRVDKRAYAYGSSRA